MQTKKGIPSTWKAVANVLESFVVLFDEKTLTGKGIAMCTSPLEKTTRFHASKVPNISITDYVIRIHSYTKCSECCLIFALIYIDRLLQKYNDIQLCKRNVHRYLQWTKT